MTFSDGVSGGELCESSADLDWASYNFTSSSEGGPRVQEGHLPSLKIGWWPEGTYPATIQGCPVGNTRDLPGKCTLYTSFLVGAGEAVTEARNHPADHYDLSGFL